MGAHISTDPAREVMDAIRRLVRLLRVFDRDAQKTAGLSAAQVFVLQQLRSGKQASINDLARRTCTDQSSVSVVVAKLVAAGLISRRQSRRDRRSALVAITPQGRTLLRASPPAAQERLIAALAKMRPDSRHRLALLLRDLIRKTGIHLHEPQMFFEDTSKQEGRHA
jgi:DNA-binding MarR family transcriptional regulator